MGGFTSPVILSNASFGVYQTEPAAALTSAGDLVVVYTNNGNVLEPSSLGATRVPRGRKPEVGRTLPTQKKIHFDPWMAKSKDGSIHLVWLGHNGNGVDRDPEIGYARTVDGGETWSTPVSVHDPRDCKNDTRYCLDRPAIAIGPVPNQPGAEVIRVFYSAPSGLRMRSTVNGGDAWTPSTTVLDSGVGDVKIDADGRVHLVTVLGEFDGPDAWGSPKNSIVYTMSEDGHNFHAPITVSAPGESLPTFFVNPSLAIDEAQGRVYVAYAAGTPDARWHIRLAFTNDGGAIWQRTQVDDGGDCVNHAIPNIAIDPLTGRLYLTWYDNRGGSGHLAYSMCQPGGAPCTPSRRVSSDMAAYELTYHSSKWLGLSEALLVDENHRILHAAWIQTVQEGSSPIGRVHHAMLPLGDPH